MIFRFPLLFSLILLEVAVKMQMSQHKPADAGSYIEKEDLVYLLSNIPVSLHEVCGNKAEPMKKQVLMLDESYLYVRFEPKYLDFHERYLGIPYQMKVTIVNVHQNRTLHLQSISGSTLDFCSSFFDDKIIPPSENTTFNVVLLGREEGEIETNLYIHTSEGIFKFKVRGMIIPNPYRVRPLLTRLPLNASFSPSLSLHNPYPSPLQLVEVYKNQGGEGSPRDGGQRDAGLSLELPRGGALPAPAKQWEIPPFQTKPILRLRYTATEHKNHTSYIRLKVNTSKEVLVVPVEIEVMPFTGLYAEEDIIDLGWGGSLDPNTKLKLYLKNSNKKAIKILGIVPVPTTEVVTVDFDPIKVPPDTHTPFHVATLNYNWAAAHRLRKCCGTILVRTQGHGRLMIPFMAKVLDGGLTYDESVTKFKTTEGPQKTRFSPRALMVSNKYRFPLAITSVSLHEEAAMYFEISNFKPIKMQPKENQTLFTIQFKPSVVLPRNNFPTSLTVQTNVSTVVIQLFCYSGRLTKITQNGHPIDLGLIGSDSRKDTYVAFMNENPVPIFLTTWGTNMTNIVLEFLGTERGNASSFLSKLHTFYNLTKSMSVLPDHYAVLRVSVFTSHIGEDDAQYGYRSGEGVQYGSVWLKTDYERATLSLKMTLAQGGLDILPDPVHIKNCFPGKICTQPLRVGSRFTTPMSVLSITPVLSNPNFGFVKEEEAMIESGTSNTIGNLTYYLPDLHFLGIHTDDRGEKAGIKWVDTLSLPSNTRDFDMENLKHQNSEFKHLLLKKINLTLKLETSAVSGHLFRTSVAMTRASITRDRVIHFPLTQIGNTSYRNITLVNPFEKHTLKVQLVLDKHYPGANTIIGEIPDSLKPPCTAGECHYTSPGEFGFEKIHQDSHVLSSPILGVHKDTPFYELEPGENITLNLAFAPSLSQKSTALLFLRNDKTVLETVLLSGIGALVQFDFANRKPGSSTPITFSYERKHVDECDNYRSILESRASSSKTFKRRKAPLEHLTIMRSFSARNTGELPIDVFGFTINGLKCQGYGFKVLNCRNFTLTPNSSRKIDISFTPDLSLTKVSRVLTIDTSMAPQGSATYTLEVSLSIELLETCAPLISRPYYESPIYWVVFFAAGLGFCVVVTSAYLDARHLCEAGYIYTVCIREELDTQPVLQLRKISSGTAPSSKGPGLSSAGSEPSLSPEPSPPRPSKVSSWSRFCRVTSGYFSSSSYPTEPLNTGPAAKSTGCLSFKDKATSDPRKPSSTSTNTNPSLFESNFPSAPAKPLVGGANSSVANGGGAVLRKRQVVQKRGSGGGEDIGGVTNAVTSQEAEGKKERDVTSSSWTTLLTKSQNKSHPSPSPSPPAPGASPSLPSTNLNNNSSSSKNKQSQQSQPAGRNSIINNHKLLNYIKKTSETTSNRNMMNFVNNPTKSNSKKFNGKQNNKDSNSDKTSGKREMEEHKRNVSDTSSIDTAKPMSNLDELIMQDSFSSDDGKSSPSSIDNQKDKENTLLAISDNSSNDSNIIHESNPSPAPSIETSAKSNKAKKGLKTHDVFTNNNIFDAKLLNKAKKSKEPSKLKKAPNDQKLPLTSCKSSPGNMMSDKQNNLDRSSALNNGVPPSLLSQDDSKLSNLNNNAHNGLSPFPSLLDHRPLYGSSLLDGMLSVHNFMSESQSQSARLNDSFRELGDSPVGSPPPGHPPRTLAPIGTPAPSRPPGLPAPDSEWTQWSQQNDVQGNQKSLYDSSLASAGWNNVTSGGLLQDNSAASFLQQHNTNQFSTAPAYEDTTWPSGLSWDPLLFSSPTPPPPTTTNPLAHLWTDAWTPPTLWSTPPPAPPNPPPGFSLVDTSTPPPPLPTSLHPPSSLVGNGSAPGGVDMQVSAQNYEQLRRFWEPIDLWNYPSNNE